MGLNKTEFKNNVKQLLTDMRSRYDVSDEEFADRLATHIETFVKTAAIKYISGLNAPNGPVTGNFTGNLE